MAGLGETGRGGGLARTRNPVLRTATSGSGSAGTPARKQAFNAEAQRAQRSRRSEVFGASRGLASRHRARRMNSCSAMAGCARPQIGLAARVAGARRAGCAGGTVGSRFTGSMRGDAKAAGGSRFKGSVRKDSKGAVGSGFAGSMRGGAKSAGGSRFKGSVRKDSKDAVGWGGTGSMRRDWKSAGGSRFKGSIRDGLNGVAAPDATGCRCAGPGPSRGASGWGWVIKKNGILAADERRWTQMSR